MSPLCKRAESKLIKSGRKWSECDYIPYRFAELYCESCGKRLGRFDIACKDLKTHMYCTECVKPFIRETPFCLGTNIQVVSDSGGYVKVKYYGDYIQEMVVPKICYFGKKGRYIKVHGMIYYLNNAVCEPRYKEENDNGEN